MFKRPLIRRLLTPSSAYSTGNRRQLSPPLHPLNPPIPKKIPFSISLHGQILEDHFHWMSNTSDPDFTQHLLQENSYAEAFMADTDGARRRLEEEMRARVPPRASAAPEAWGDWCALVIAWFFAALRRHWIVGLASQAQTRTWYNVGIAEVGVVTGVVRALFVPSDPAWPMRSPPHHEIKMYYQYIPEGKEYPVLCRKQKNQNGFTKTLLNWFRGCAEEVLLDWNEIAEQFGYVHIGTCRISPDHRFIAYTLDTSGSEMFMLHVKNLQTGQITSDPKRKGVVSLAWAGGSSCLLYTVCNQSQRPYRVFSTNLGSSMVDDLIFTENDLTCCVDIASTKDGKYITINSNSRSSSEVYVIDAMNLQDGVWPIRKRVPGVQYFLEHHNGYFYILTNAPSKEMASAANSFYLVRCQAANSLLDNWQVIIEPDQDILFQDFDIYNGHLVLSVMTERLPLFCSIDMYKMVNHKDQKPMKLADLKPWFFPLPSSLCSIMPGSNLDFMSSVYRLVISSPVMPDLVVDYDMKRCVFTVLHQEEVLGMIKHNSSSSDLHLISGKQNLNKQHLYMVEDLLKLDDLSEEFSCERRDIISHDGVRVPLTIVYSRRAEHDGQSPGILHGYGAYGEVLDKSFSSEDITLLSRGWVIAYADVRGGGGDLAWHKAGARHCKLNSVHDFAACAMFLINEGYVHKNQLCAIGSSAGGLLVGATINMFPDLFSAAILKVPFLDICNTLLDPSLPLTNLDYEEFGDPTVLADFKIIRRYSPYDNICFDACYPSLLVTASFHDSRVGVWEAAKWVARVRERTCCSCSRSVILKTNMSGGHFGEGGRYSHCQDAAFDYAFLIKAMGLLHQVKI